MCGVEMFRPANAKGRSMTMEERVNRLERRNRQLLVAIAAMLSVGVLAVFVAGRMAIAQASTETEEELRKMRVAVGMVMATAQARAEMIEEVRAKRLVIVDDLGTVRVAIDVIKPGFPRWLRRYGTLTSVRSLVWLVLHGFHVTTSGIPHG